MFALAPFGLGCLLLVVAKVFSAVEGRLWSASDWVGIGVELLIAAAIGWLSARWINSDD